MKISVKSGLFALPEELRKFWEFWLKGLGLDNAVCSCLCIWILLRAMYQTCGPHLRNSEKRVLETTVAAEGQRGGNKGRKALRAYVTDVPARSYPLLGFVSLVPSIPTRRIVSSRRTLLLLGA